MARSVDVTLLPQTRISLEYAFGVRPAESLLVLSDATMSSAILDAFAAAGWALRASVIGMSHTLLELIAMRDLLDVDGQSIVDEGVPCTYSSASRPPWQSWSRGRTDVWNR